MNFWYISHEFTKIHIYHIFYMKCTVFLVFSCGFSVFSLLKHELLVHFTWIYQNTHIPYILHKMHCFARVFMCFHCIFTAETCTFGTFYMYIPKYSCTIYSTWNAQFCKCFHVFSLCFYCRNMKLWYFSHEFTKIHMYQIFYMKCTVLLVFSCIFTVFLLQKHELLVHFTWIYQNTHVPYILHEMHCFASVFMCLHCVFTAETCTFGIFHLFTEIHMYHIFYMKCIVLLVFSCVFSAETCIFGTFHMNLPKYTCAIYSTWNKLFR
jgi:hypothetical protein